MKDTLGRYVYNLNFLHTSYHYFYNEASLQSSKEKKGTSRNKKTIRFE